MTVKITIIGAGPGGYAAALRAARPGVEVTIIEQDNVGGVCLNRGCIPSKVMKTTAEMMEDFRRAGEFGIKVNGDFCTNMQRLMARKQKVIRDQTEGIVRSFSNHKIRYLKGLGYIKRHGLAGVKQDDGKMVEVPWDRLILAPGSQPSGIPSFPFDGGRIISSNEALDLREIPESMVIVGGGIIGCELASIFASLGSAVVIVEAMERLLPFPTVDEDCSRTLQREMKKRGIKLMVNRTVEKIEDAGGKVCVTIAPSPLTGEPEGKTAVPLTVCVDMALICVGRAPGDPIDGLEKLGIRTDDQGWIKADDRMETGVSGVYAIGDALGPSRIMLAHVASSEGFVAADNALGKNRMMNYDVVPTAIFTIPEVANAGLTEAQASMQGYNVRSDSVLFRTIGKAQVTGQIAGQAKIVSDSENGRILGVHIVGAHAADLIAEGTLAVKTGCTIKELAETIHAHPTFSEVMWEASLMALSPIPFSTQETRRQRTISRRAYRKDFSPHP